MSDRIDTLLVAATKKLAVLPSPANDSARLDAELLMSHSLSKPRSYLFTWPEKTLSETEYTQFQHMIEQRIQGIPVAYLTGEKEFWNLSLEVNNHVLIPRPDTELIVELALSLSLPEHAQVADLGTGTGAIALALAKERPDWQVDAIDQSLEALNIARKNASHNTISNVSFLSGSWCTPLKGRKLDMIVSNPPYIKEDDPHLKQGDVRFEPLSALTSGHDGLDDIRLIITESAQHLNPGGWLLIEHGYDQGSAVAELMSRQGFSQVGTRQDLAGQDRVTLGALLTLKISGA